MSASPATSLPRPPAERTFVIAVTVLSIAAVAQLIAVVVALAPQVNLDRIGQSLAARPAADPAAPPAPVDPALAQKANSYLEEAAQFRAQGNFNGALQAVTEADRLVPDKPGILMQMAHDYASLGKNPEAVGVLKRIVALPAGTDPAEAPIREQAKAALAQMGDVAEPTAEAPAKDSGAMRDDVGIPIGSVMGIVKAELVDAEPGQKNLRVATKAASNQKIDSQRFVATVDFYEQDDSGELQHADAQMTEWLSLPATWANAEPELFQTKYRMPLADRGDLPPLQFYGYVVAIYYNGELQDQRADPVSLLDKFPPPVHKDSATE